MPSSTTTWHAALVALAVCASGASMAQSGPDTVAEPSANETEATPARPFIERSLVIAPEQVGKFTLQEMKDYPGQPGAGIQVRYRHEDVPDLRLDLFVYPAGRVDRGQVLDLAMADLRASLQHAVDKGSYSNLEIGDEGEFDLRRVDADGSMLPEGEPLPQAGADTGLGPSLAAVAEAEDYRVGRVLQARLNIGEEAVDSRGYLFYRGLYLVKGRVSASPRVLPGESLDRFARHAMATLVPAISTRSTGGCARNEIVVDPKAADVADALARQLVAASERVQQEQCAPELDEAIPEGHRAMPLVYPPELWQG